MIDNPFSCDIDAFVTIQETVMRLRTIGLIRSVALKLRHILLPFTDLALRSLSFCRYFLFGIGGGV